MSLVKYVFWKTLKIALLLKWVSKALRRTYVNE